MKIVALVIKVFKFDLIENGAFHEFFGTEPVIDDGPGSEVSHARLHRAALVARSTVINAENGIELALVPDDHAGAELCRFDAAHFFCGRKAADCSLWRSRISEIQAGPDLSRNRNHSEHLAI